MYREKIEINVIDASKQIILGRLEKLAKDKNSEQRNINQNCFQTCHVGLQ